MMKVAVLLVVMMAAPAMARPLTMKALAKLDADTKEAGKTVKVAQFAKAKADFEAMRKANAEAREAQVAKAAKAKSATALVETSSAKQPVTACAEVKCAPISCSAPFHVKTDGGSCCPVCWSDEVVVAEDRTWTKTLSGGIGMDPNADAYTCRNVVCLKPDCAGNEQVFDGRCCTKCQSSVDTVSAADRRAELGLVQTSASVDLDLSRAEMDLSRAEQPMTACAEVKCAPISCSAPFHVKTDGGSCCPVCWSDEVVVAEDRTWTKTLGGGIGMDPNADAYACRNVVCVKPDCAGSEQAFDGRCCTKCQSSIDTVSAADRRAELPR